jgi:fructokinase
MRVGVDLGGTKIEAVALDGAGAARFRKRVPTPRGDYDGTVAAVVALVAEAERATGARASVGVGIPGIPVPETGLVQNANSTWLIGRPFPADLERALGRPVRVTNDANCFALSEAADGAAAGASVVFGVIVGTGTGGGIVVDGRVLVGRNGIAGEWGHNPLPWPRADETPGPLCYCGKRGCIETFLSGPGIARDHEAATGERLDAAVLAERAAAGHASARATLDRHAERAARALAGVVNVLDPDVVVLGGGVSNLPGLCEEVSRRWGAWIGCDRIATKLVRARHGDASGARGAARLWPDAESPVGSGDP